MFKYVDITKKQTILYNVIKITRNQEGIATVILQFAVLILESAK